jgi:ankyrin repeat protein
MLLRRGARPLTFDIYGLSPLHKAAGFGSSETLKVLLVKGKVEPNLRTTDVTAPLEHESRPSLHETALHIAARVGQPRAASLLLAAGADTNIQNRVGDVPLHCCCRRNKFKDTRMLLRAGALTDIRNHAGKTPVDESGALLAFLITSGILAAVPDFVIRAVPSDRIGDSNFRPS